MTSLLILEVVARGGGGGSGGGGGAGGLLAIPIIIVGLIIGWHKRRKKIQKAQTDLSEAVQNDSSWSEENIKKRAEEVFYLFQEDWSQFNVESMQGYLTVNYMRHMSLVLMAMYQLGRQNVMENVVLKSSTLLEVHDQFDDEEDRFSIEVSAMAEDKLIEKRTGNILKLNTNNFSELWHFEREGDTWLLEGISQATGKLTGGYGNPEDSKYVAFAKKNNYFYNEDFGWLLLPLNGTLFGEAKFDTSDINHHVIGQHGDRVVQFFEYVPIIQDKRTLIGTAKRLLKRQKRAKASKYTVAQITMPKSYGDIIVERKGFLSTIGLSIRPKGMQKMSYSPVAFGKKFDVYASDEEQVTSFELLHPAYLEKLIELEYQLDIEVSGDNLYLYTSDKKADYESILHLLKSAYKELER